MNFSTSKNKQQNDPLSLLLNFWVKKRVNTEFRPPDRNEVTMLTFIISVPNVRLFSEINKSSVLISCHGNSYLTLVSVKRKAGLVVKNREVYDFKNVKVYGFENMEVYGFKNMKVCGFKNIKVYVFKNMKVYVFKNMKVYGFKNMEVYGFTTASLPDTVSCIIVLQRQENS